jgi:hypothetical protein
LSTQTESRLEIGCFSDLDSKNTPPQQGQLNGTSEDPERYVVLQPGPHDVLCDRSPAAFRHAGNTRFRAICKQFVAPYTKAETKSEKGKVFKSIVKTVAEFGGQFLGRKNETGRWEQLSSDRRIIGKVGHALRAAAIQQERATTAERHLHTHTNFALVKFNTTDRVSQKHLEYAEMKRETDMLLKSTESLSAIFDDLLDKRL